MKNQATAQVLFACIHNAGRSQMAAALFNALADPSKARAISAGTHPGSRVHPVVLEAMHEVGLDLSAAKPQLLTAEVASGSKLLVTMGCGEECPYIPGAQRDDWPLDDPANLPLEQVRPIREEVRRRVTELIRKNGWEVSAR